MTRLAFFVDGTPVPYDRTSARWGRTRPEEVVWRRDVTAAYYAAGGKAPAIPYVGRVAVALTFRGVWRPDVDNLAKPVLDALNGLAFADDCQVVRLLSEVPDRQLSAKGRPRKVAGASGCQVVIEWLDGEGT